MKFEVYREVQFSSAHRLRNYHGKCENLHGHNWRVRLVVTRDELDETGFVMDFKVLNAVLNESFEISLFVVLLNLIVTLPYEYSGHYW